MPGEELSVDDLLADQEKQGALRVTIESIPDDSERVRVTPFIAGLGCSCDRALNLKKDQIQSISKTDEVHLCCGKQLFVVEISFNNDTLTDLFQQLSDPARSPAASASNSRLTSVHPEHRVWHDRRRGATGRRFLPVANYHRAASNEVYLSTEEAALGIHVDFTNPFEHLLGPAICGHIRGNCYDRCRELQVAFGLDEDAFFRCIGDCDDAYARCLNGS